MRLIIGLGTGRCGTTSIAEMLNAQQGVHATHEFCDSGGGFRLHGTHRRALLRWDGTSDLGPCIEDLRGRSAAVVAEVSFFSLPYITRYRAAFDDVRVFTVRRGREATIDSYMRWTPERDHWRDNSGRPDSWDRCYPTYKCATKREAIGRYYDEYYEAAEPLAGAEIRTESLSDPDAVGRLMRWAGVEADEITTVHTNRGS